VNQYALAPEEDGGIAWKPIEGQGTVCGIWGTANDLWMIVDNSDFQNWERAKILHGVPGPKGGFEWTSVDSQSTLRLEAIWGSSPDDIWAVGDKGIIRRMKKGATRWEIIPSPTQEQLHGVWGSAADDVWAVGDRGTILHFDGTEWKPSLAAFTLGKKPDLRGVWGSSKDDVWIVGESGALHYTGPKPVGGGGN
ncbi:MAG: Type fimbrial biosis protein PilY1, partial [Labilithrix sp.]|nr:Type fimbrial biosis protein PilY1 [Labilithrix sp.]